MCDSYYSSYRNHIQDGEMSSPLSNQEGCLQKEAAAWCNDEKIGFGVRLGLGCQLGPLSCVPRVGHGPSLSLSFFPVRQVFTFPA